MDFLFVVIGIVLLYFGGDLLVDHAVSLADRLGISPLVIGLTVVAFGTSAPELATTLASTFQGAPELAVGNVVGSNTANVGLILGVAALIFPLQAQAKFVRREVPVMILVGLLLAPLLWDGVVTRFEGVLLLLALAGYLVYLFKTDSEAVEVEEADSSAPLWRDLLLLALGIALLVGGARVLVEGAVGLARAYGISESVIGLTLVAFGTSLPELASAAVAAFKKNTDIVLGNVIGSNVFNVLAVLGTTALVTPVAQPFAGVGLDILIMTAFGAVTLLLMLGRSRLGRTGGAFLLVAYLVYIAYLFVR